MSDARAVVLGDLRSSSRLGELLHAEIEIDDEPADRFDASCVTLYRPAQASSDLPWITEARLSFRRESGKGKLYISSDQALHDPVVQLGIAVTCPGGRLWRDYTLLLAPAAQVVAEKPSERALPSLHGTSKARSGVSKPLQHLDREIAYPAPRKPRGISAIGAIDTRDADRALVLRLALELQAPDSPGDTERELLRLEYRLLTALYEQAESQYTLAEKLRQLEHGASELKTAGERLGVSAVLAPQPVLPPVSEKTEPAVMPPVLVPVPKATPASMSVAESEDSIGWPLYAMPVVVALFILLLVRRRRRAAALDALFLPMHAPTIIVDEPGFSQPPEQAAALSIEVADEAPIPVPAVPLDIPPSPEKIEVTPVMELAEIMLSFGRIQGAAQTLQEYIEANPKEALRPWIRLLEIYRENGMRTEFETLATNLNRNFNVEVVHWDKAVPGERIEMTLELLPHIRDQIDALWGSNECLEYLQKLLRDNRDGQRSGFSLPVVREILLLIDLMAAEKAAAK